MKRSIELAFLLDDKGKFWLSDLETEKCIREEKSYHLQHLAIMRGFPDKSGQAVVVETLEIFIYISR